LITPFGGQALRYRFVLQYLKKLDIAGHPKFWRSSVLLLAQDADMALLHFGKHFSRSGAFIIGTLLVWNFIGMHCRHTRKAAAHTARPT
jgi:hypothetical protein